MNLGSRAICISTGAPCPQGNPQCRVNPEIVNVVTVFIACSNLVKPLAEHLLKCMTLVSSASLIHQMATTATDDAKTLVKFPHKKKPCTRRDICSGKINENGSVEIRPDRLFLTFTIPEHGLNLQ
jgi:hypothetical protein